MRTEILWEWEEAFNKFGFDDGDGPNFTNEVVMFINYLGYLAEPENWGIHNYMIMSILDKDGNELMDENKIRIGYDDPRDYLPPELVSKLDAHFPAG